MSAFGQKRTFAYRLAFEGDAYVAMIEAWRSAIEARIEQLAGADIR